MKLEELYQKAKVLDKEEAQMIRTEYINTFIDKDSQYYTERILNQHKFPDGEYSWGYLWECLKEYNRAKKQYVLHHAHNHEDVYVFWDIHSAHHQNPASKRYWNFDRNAVIKLNYQDVLKYYELMPEDIYICDEFVTWTIIFTHEYIGYKDLVYMLVEK